MRRGRASARAVMMANIFWVEGALFCAMIYGMMTNLFIMEGSWDANLLASLFNDYFVPVSLGGVKMLIMFTWWAS